MARLVTKLLYDIAEARGADAGRNLAEGIKYGSPSPISLSWGVDNILKDKEPRLLEVLLGAFYCYTYDVYPGDLAQAYLDALEAELPEGWFVHGDEGDGTQIWVCDGTCDQCREEAEGPVAEECEAMI
jgi:hypothetical protein